MARGGARGGGSGGRDRGPPNRETQVSKKLSWLLRHGAEKEGLTLGKGGYVNLNDILTNRNIKSLQPRPTLDEVKSIVATNAKQRFSLVHISSQKPVNDISESDSAAPTNPSPASQPSLLPDDPNPSNYLIRANQGHSLAIEDAADLLTPISAANAPKMVVHGTRRETWQQILHSGGLKPMTRTHVHFATGLPEELAQRFEAADAGSEDTKGLEPSSTTEDAKEVLSGMRNSSTLLIYLDLERAMAAGVPFFMSKNGVVLSEGATGTGIVGVEFFAKVVGRGGKVFMRDGKVEG